MDPRVAEFRVVGLCAAPFASFDAEGGLHLGGIAAQVDELVKGGVVAAFVNGTTGESLSLTHEERKTVLERWVADAGERLAVIAHVGAQSLADTCDLAAHAERVGAKAYGFMPPTFFRPATLDALVDWIRRVAASAPSIPAYYYHIPSMTGANFRMIDLLEKVEAVGIPNFRGIKFTDYNLYDFMECVRFQDGRYDMLYGRDEQILGALAMGARGAVGSTYNYMGGCYNRLIKAFERGDMEAAREEQAHSAALVDLLGSSAFGAGVHVGKAIAVIKGCPIGDARAPWTPIKPEGIERLREALVRIRFFEWAD